MANEKRGLSYYTMDTDRYMDIRIKRLKRSFGCNGYAVYSYLLNEVYRVEGAALQWNEATRFDVSEYWDLPENEIEEIVDYCAEIGLFDKTMLHKGYITSAAIQKRYVLMCSRAKRKAVGIPESYRIIAEEYPITPEESVKITEESQVTLEVCDKEKKRKEKENISLSFPLSCENGKNEITEEEREKIFEIFYFERNLVTAKEECEKFINHYEANGWCRGNSSKPVKNKVALAKSWKVEREEKRLPEKVCEWLHGCYLKVREQGLQSRLLFEVERAYFEGENLFVQCSRQIAELIETVQKQVPRDFTEKLFYRVRRE